MLFGDVVRLQPEQDQHVSGRQLRIGLESPSFFDNAVETPPEEPFVQLDTFVRRSCTEISPQ